MKTQLGDIAFTAPFITKLFEFGRFEFEIFIDIWFWLYDATLMSNDTLLRNAKRET